jgi:hypothetical protein
MKTISVIPVQPLKATSSPLYVILAVVLAGCK